MLTQGMERGVNSSFMGRNKVVEVPNTCPKFFEL